MRRYTACYPIPPHPPKYPFCNSLKISKMKNWYFSPCSKYRLSACCEGAYGNKNGSKIWRKVVVCCKFALGKGVISSLSRDMCNL